MTSDPRYDAAALKSRGIMEEKELGRFTIRLGVVGGRVGASNLQALSEIVSRYADGHVHLTTRQGMEIPHVRFEDIEPLCSDLEAAGIQLGRVGRRVRTITACQGLSCRHGLIDPQSLAQTVDRKVAHYSGLPHKFKIGITGCPNACIKPYENDLGIMGVAEKDFREDLCSACGVCVEACPLSGALGVQEDRLVRRDDLCIGCGKCIAACPTGAWESTGPGYVLFVGGKMGRQPRLGERLPFVITDDDKLLAVIEAVIEWYAANGAAGERFGSTLERVGVEKLAEDIVSVVR